MHIKNIKVNNFRNLENAEINFGDKINVIYGNNAQGKTNILETIYLFAFGKSFRANKDSELLMFGSEYFFTKLVYEKKGIENEISISFDKNANKKYIKINKVPQKKLSELLGNLNLVIFKPDDVEIVKGSPSNRRKFLDILISSIEPKYIYILLQYNKNLEERNTILKQIKAKKVFLKDVADLLDIYTTNLIKYNNQIYEYRKKYIQSLNSKIVNIHKNISNYQDYSEEIVLQYDSKCGDIEKLKKEFEKSIENEIQKGYTEIGIHRDDIIIKIDSKEVGKFGSQGQQKSATLSLKLAELKVIEEKINDKPILLLDDFMSELDDNRVKNIIENLKDLQIIITTTSKTNIGDRTNKFLFVNKRNCGRKGIKWKKIIKNMMQIKSKF